MLKKFGGNLEEISEFAEMQIRETNKQLATGCGCNVDDGGHHLNGAEYFTGTNGVSYFCFNAYTFKCFYYGTTWVGVSRPIITRPCIGSQCSNPFDINVNAVIIVFVMMCRFPPLVVLRRNATVTRTYRFRTNP